jgi:hypothetical protein
VEPYPFLVAQVVCNRPHQAALVALNRVVLLVPVLQLQVQLVLQAHHNRAAAHNFSFFHKSSRFGDLVVTMVRHGKTNGLQKDIEILKNLLHLIKSLKT